MPRRSALQRGRRAHDGRVDVNRWLRIGREVLALLLAASCPGCDEPGTLMCDECRMRLRAAPHRLVTPTGLPVHAALVYEGVAARSIRRLKQEGATMLAVPLGAAVRALLGDEAGTELIVPVPTSRAAFRRRGYRVPELLVKRAGFACARVLVPIRRTGDQRGLGRAERARNVSGSMRARRCAQPGRRVVIFDDVVTTGATLDEAARALREAGFVPVCAVALAATPRRRDTRELTVNG